MIPGLVALLSETKVTRQRVASATYVATASSHTYSAQNFGAAATGRVMVACLGSSGLSITQTSVTIGGVTATQIAQIASSASPNQHIGIWAAVVPAGTSGDVVVNYSGSAVAGALELYALIGASGAAAFASATDNGTTLSGSINIPAGGVGIGAAYDAGASVNGGAWTNLTEDADVTFGTTIHMYAASDELNVAQTALAISLVITSVNDPAFAVASWGP